MNQYAVNYEYDGGRGREIVQTASESEATAAGMAAAVPQWNPGAAVRHTGTFRMLSYDDLHSEPHAGITEAVDLSWDQRDMGGGYLVVERGSELAPDLRDYWTQTGRIVMTAPTLAQAQQVADEETRRAARRGISGRYDAVPRDAVQVQVIGAPYGCVGNARTA